STQLHPEQMDEGFTATAYLKVQDNLKLTVQEQVILEEPVSSTWTLSSLQHLAKDLSFGDLFFNDKPFEADNEKTTAKTEAESMVFVTIQQDTSSIPPMTTPIIDLTSRPDSPNVDRLLQATATETTTTTTTTTPHPTPPQPQQSTTNSMLMKCIDEFEQIMANLIQDNKHLEESSTWTLSSLQHLAKDLSFGDLFFNDKPFEADNEKTTAKTEAESMVFVTIQQDTSSIPPMTTPIIDLTSRPDSPNVDRLLQATATETTTTTTTTTPHPTPPQPQQSTTNSMLMKCIDEFEQIMANLIQDNKNLEERLDNHGARLYKLENLDIPQQETNSYKTHEDHMMLYEALEKSVNHDHTDELLKDLVEARKKKKKRRDSSKTPPGSPPHQPPPPPPPAGPSGTLGSPGASGSSQVLPLPPPPPSTNPKGQSHVSTAPSYSKIDVSAEYKAWTTTDTRIRPSASSTPEDLHMDDDMAPDAQAHSSDDEDIGNAYIPKLNLRQYWWEPLEEDRPATSEPAWSIPSSDVPVPKNNWTSALASTYSPPLEDSLLVQTGDMAMCMDWFCKRQGITELRPQDLEGPAFELVKVFHPNVTIQSDFFFNKDLEYLRYDIKGSRPALSILKMKAAYYPDVGLEQMVPNQMRIEEECKYDIAAMSPEPSTTQRQEDSHYCSQLMDQTLGYQTTRRRLPPGD
nr:hypothetical protein [Tanacetum cinerariifolium]